MVQNIPTRAALVIGACLGTLLLAQGLAAARATSTKTWGTKPKSYTEYLQLCNNRPDIPACRTASFYFGKLAKKGKISSGKRFYANLRLNLALRKARKQRLRMMERTRDNDRNYFRRLWSKARYKLVALKTMVFGRTKAAASVKSSSPFHNTGNFGHYVQRSRKHTRTGWVFKRGRLGGSKEKKDRFKKQDKAAKRRREARAKKESKRERLGESRAAKRRLEEQKKFIRNRREAGKSRQ